ncbi:IS1182 family transposase [Alloalcanivorax mobilis]|uniref:IS1182 family transposase n=1 Tax=Alloalcanivorax mobilis TaxID=2019569 RepID=UPI000C78F401|nr:IS1182 family transposase [Alloalcanivorax mobilis]
MLKDPGPTQHELEMVTLEELVPSDHLLRRIDAIVDFSFIRDEVRHLYCDDNGRPALDPVVLFKALFIGYLFGIRSERQLVRELQVNVAYRWFLGLRLTDKVPDASTFSQNRRRRFRDSDIAQRLFDRIVEQAMERGLVGGRILYTDSTHIKASANRHHYTVEDVEVSPQAYLAELEESVTEDREAHGKKPLPPRPEAEPETARKKISKTDPDSGYMVREGKPKGFFYLDHRTVDAKHTIITDVHVTPASVHDSVPYLERLDRQSERFGFEVEAVGLDAGYFTAAICQGLDKRELYGVIGYRRPNKAKGMMAKRLFVYDETNDVYRCPEGQALRYATTNRQGYRHYQSDPAWCRSCPRLAECTRNDKKQKTVTRHVWEAAKERVNRHRLESEGKQVYERRKETVERSFADAKQLHGYRYARMRGLAGMREQALLSAAAQNLKKMALAA